MGRESLWMKSKQVWTELQQNSIKLENVIGVSIRFVHSQVTVNTPTLSVSNVKRQLPGSLSNYDVDD
jgi:hypothetical protein